MIKSLLEKVISTLFILLFIYSATGKIVHYHNFEFQLGRSPIIMKYTALAWLVPVVELGTVVLLVFKTTRITGLFVSLLLMILYSAYIGLIAISHCEIVTIYEGIFKGRSLKTNLVFNSFFMAFAIAGIFNQFESKMPAGL